MGMVEGLLDGPRAREAFILRALLDPPWSLRVEDEAALTLIAVVSGRAWIVHDGARRTLLVPGEVALVRGPDRYTVADPPEAMPEVIIPAVGECVSESEARPLESAWDRGIRTWGPGGDTVMLVGTYSAAGEVSRPLLDRLLDAALIAAVRAWFSQQGAAAPGWFRAQEELTVSRALALLHDDAARSWTVTDLAHEVGTSRAALGRRFARLVGEPPMSYLTGWRLALAADLLQGTSLTVAAIATRVGYATPFSLSSAFKRRYKVGPQQYRRGGVLPSPTTRGVSACAAAGLLMIAILPGVARTWPGASDVRLLGSPWKDEPTIGPEVGSRVAAAGRGVGPAVAGRVGWRRRRPNGAPARCAAAGSGWSELCGRLHRPGDPSRGSSGGRVQSC